MITIYPADIPDEGLHLSGSIKEDIFQLDPEDEVQSTGPTVYDLTIYLSDDLLLVEGSVEAPFRLECAACLKPFAYTCRIDNFLEDIDLEGSKPVELTELLREDLLLALPPYPHCDQGDDPDHVCPMAGKFDAPEPELDSGKKPSAWDALDGLGTTNESRD